MGLDFWGRHNSKQIRWVPNGGFFDFWTPAQNLKMLVGKYPKPSERIKKESKMSERKRAIQLKLWVDENEKNLIEEKMKILGTCNFGAYARKMLIDGYIIKVDYTEQKKLAAAVNKVGANINNICRRILSTGNTYREDVSELKSLMEEIWRLLKSRLSEEQ